MIVFKKSLVAWDLCAGWSRSWMPPYEKVCSWWSLSESAGMASRICGWCLLNTFLKWFFICVDTLSPSWHALTYVFHMTLSMVWHRVLNIHGKWSAWQTVTNRATWHIGPPLGVSNRVIWNSLDFMSFQVHLPSYAQHFVQLWGAQLAPSSVSWGRRFLISKTLSECSVCYIWLLSEYIVGAMMRLRLLQLMLKQKNVFHLLEKAHCMHIIYVYVLKYVSMWICEMCL